MAVVLDADPIIVVSDVDDDDTLGPSDLFRSTMSPELSQYEDSHLDQGEYYLGRDLDYVAGECIGAGLIDDDAVWVASANGLIRSWSAQGVVERDLHLTMPPRSSPLSSAVFVQDGWALGDSAGRLFVANQFAEIRSDLADCRHDDLISHMAAMPGAGTAQPALVITAGWDGAVHVADLGQGALAHRYQPCRCPVEYVLAASPALIWTAAVDGCARLLDVRARDCVQVVRGDDGAVTPVRCVALGSGTTATTLYMAHGHGQLAAVDIRTGKVVRRYFGHDDVVNRILARADRIISAGDDRQIRIFDVGSCVSIDKLDGHRHALTELVVLGAALISADAEGAVRRYDLDTVERFHARRMAEQDDEKKARDLIAAQQATAKASSKSKKSKKGSKKPKKKKK